MLGTIRELLRHRTVMILGAGASAEYGLPLGPALKQEMINAVHSGHLEERHLTAGGFDRATVARLAESLAGTSHETIDAFLARKPSLRAVGGFMAAMTIMKHEHAANQKLFPRKGWYGRLYTELSLEDPPPNLENLTIVTLNYDRTLEHFLSKTIDHDCDESKEATARSSLNRIRIVHPHGSVGEYPKDIFPGLFGEPNAVKAAGDNVRIISDNLEESNAYREARALIAMAENVLFFGFGYHKETIQGLFKNADPAKQVVFGTKYKYQGDPKVFFEGSKNHFAPDSHTCGDYLNNLKPEFVRGIRGE